MKILVLGLDNSIFNTDSKLAKRAVEYGNLVEKYIVIVPFKEDKILKLSDKAGVNGVGAKNKIFCLLKIYKLAKKIIKEENINVISVQDQYYLGLLGLMLARKFRIGLEIQVHGFEKYFGLRKLIAKYLLPRAKAIRCVSQRLKKQLIGEFGVKEERIIVVPIYIDVNIKCQILNVKTNSDKFIFLTVGRLVPVKNIKMQIEAIAEINKKSQIANRKSQIELWIVGDGEERKKLEKLCYVLCVTSYVKFFGWQDDLEKFYEQADAFLLTSNYEGWGLAVIEAAVNGLPIIMTDVGCAGEVIQDGISGIVIPEGDQKKLEEVMVRLREDEYLRKKLGEGAREAVKNLLGKEEIFNLYKESWKKTVI